MSNCKDYKKNIKFNNFLYNFGIVTMCLRYLASKEIKFSLGYLGAER
jgi:hypothetical protein